MYSMIIRFGRGVLLYVNRPRMTWDPQSTGCVWFASSHCLHPRIPNCGVPMVLYHGKLAALQSPPNFRKRHGLSLFCKDQKKNTLLRVIPTMALCLTYILAFHLAFNLAYILTFYLTYILAFYLPFYLAYILAFHLAVEVQQCSLSSGGPRLRPSGCSLRSDPGGWGQAVLTAIQSWRIRLGRSLAKRIGDTLDKEDWRDTWRGEEGGEGEEGGAALIKSSNPHLAGGEQLWWTLNHMFFWSCRTRKRIHPTFAKLPWYLTVPRPRHL